MSSAKFYLEKYEKALGQITTALFQERVIRGMYYAESVIDCLKNDPKNANMNFDNFSIHFTFLHTYFLIHKTYWCKFGFRICMQQCALKVSSYYC